MKTVVITGSARGLGFEMAKLFKKKNLNVIISDLNEENLIRAKEELDKIKSNSKVEQCVCNVTKYNDIQNLINFSKEKFKKIDIWINNAGVNQPEKAIWELTEQEINMVLDVNLKGAIIGSKLIMEEMIKNKSGAIYNVEGYGSNDAKMLGLSIYGTSKRAITYFTEALAKECEERNTGIIVGKLSPGIMITDFIKNALGDKEKINLSEKTKKVYNILGDYPDVVANFLVNGILNNKKNGAKIEWLTNKKAAWRFMTARFNKRDFFKK
ncbi:MAG: SDR family oxidoreductase [Bacilli bacterium]|nr:SDR family oxidoreductase [Bacilli bacterium]